ncbi:unnamed protein product, partial [Didymodactylos carnosus]
PFKIDLRQIIRVKTPSPSCPYIGNRSYCLIIKGIQLGRLGNNLFTLASTYGLARTHSCYLYADGGWQSYLYFVNYTNEIRQLFTFRSHIVSEVAVFFRYIYKNRTETSSKRHVTQLELKNEIISSGNTWVGVHIRRGDYLRGGKNVSSLNFILNAMDYFVKKYGNKTIFILTSDDKRYCKITFGNLTNTYISPTTFSPAQDLAILTICQHTIFTIGTFGWWGGFLSSGEVIHDIKSPKDPRPREVGCARETYFAPWFSYLNTTT